MLDSKPRGWEFNTNIRNGCFEPYNKLARLPHSAFRRRHLKAVGPFYLEGGGTKHSHIRSKYVTCLGLSSSWDGEETGAKETVNTVLTWLKKGTEVLE